MRKSPQKRIKPNKDICLRLISFDSWEDPIKDFYLCDKTAKKTTCEGLRKNCPIKKWFKSKYKTRVTGDGCYRKTKAINCSGFSQRKEL